MKENANEKIRGFLYICIIKKLNSAYLIGYKLIILYEK